MLRDELLRPRSVVVVGGSGDLSRPGGAVLRNIINSGYTGSIYVLNPCEREVQGFVSYNDARSVPDVECAIFAVSASKVIKTAEILADQKRTKAFIVLSAGFSETGQEGKNMEQRLVDIVNAVDGTLVGPNCTGIVLPGFAATFAGPVPEFDPRGADFAAGSGAVAVFTLERAILMGIRFSSIITVGNSAQFGVEEVIRHWDESFDETGSRVKLLYMEQVKDPGLFIKHSCSLIKKGCRIAAVKAGTSQAGLRAAQSHTGALAGPDMAVDALFRKCGITRCTGREDLVYTAGVLMHDLPAGKNMAVITHAGGPGVMATDALSDGGINVPELAAPAEEKLRSGLFPGSSTSNPIDFLGTGTAQHLGLILDVIDNECPGIDGSIVIFGTPGLTDVSPVYDFLNEKMSVLRKPVFPVLPSTMMAGEAIHHFTEKGRIYFPDEVLLARSIASVVNTGRPFPAHGASPEKIRSIREITDASPDGYLAPEKVRDILDLTGIGRVREVSVRRENEIGPACTAVGFPLAMKAAGLLHKSDSGGVRLNIQSVDEAGSAFRELLKISGAEGALVQEMALGIELFIGGRHVSPYGHIILCGTGGIFVEILGDVSAGIVPVSQSEALDMIRRLKGYGLIKGARGAEGVNEDLFSEIIALVSSLLHAVPEITELDINPLIGRGDIIRAVDCRIRLERGRK